MAADLLRPPGRPGLRRDLWPAAGLLLVAVLVTLADLPTPVRAPLVVLSIGSLALTVARRRRRGTFDAVAVACGGLLGVLVLAGLVLNLLPTGLDRIGWALALLVVGAAVLAVETARPLPADRPAVRPDPRAVSRRGLVYLPALAIAVLAVVLSVRATDHAEVAPLALSATRVGAHSARIEVSSGRKRGPYRLLLRRSSGDTVVARALTLDGEADYTTTVALPASGRVAVLLTAGGHTLRRLILYPG